MAGIGNGGELTVAFDLPILKDPAGHADGMDFTIFGNEFFVLGNGNITGIYNHPGLTVWVSEDNITYYQLAAPSGTDDLYPTEGSGDPGPIRLCPIQISAPIASVSILTCLT